MMKKRWALLLVCVLGACEAEPPEGAEAEAEAAGGSEDVASVSSALSGSMVGVIPDKNVSCPGERVDIQLYPEWNRNENHHEGWVGDWIWNDDAVGRMVFCKVSSEGFKRAKGSSPNANYAVLKLGASCPAESFEAIRYFDLEDSDYSPSFVEEDRTHPPSHHGGAAGQNLWLYLCVFKGAADGSSTPFPDRDFRYGVLGSPGVPGDTAHGWAHNDDEDDRNHTHWEYEGDSVDLSTIIEGDENSRMHLVRVR
jgi:hypothetical protein